MLVRDLQPPMKAWDFKVMSGDSIICIFSTPKHTGPSLKLHEKTKRNLTNWTRDSLKKQGGRC